MTDQERRELEREISELIEPLATLPKVGSGYSPLKAWFYRAGIGWYACEWTKREGPNARLFDMLRQDAQKSAKAHPFYSLLKALELTTEDRKTETALAFRAWKRSDGR